MVGCNGCCGMLLRSSSWIEAIIPSAASNIGSRWLSDGSLFRILSSVEESHVVQAHRQPTTNDWSMPKYECQSSLSQGRTEFLRGLAGWPLWWPLCHPSMQSYFLHSLLVLNPWELSRKLPACAHKYFHKPIIIAGIWNYLYLALFWNCGSFIKSILRQ